MAENVLAEADLKSHISCPAAHISQLRFITPGGIHGDSVTFTVNVSASTAPHASVTVNVTL